jgi:hypothetical protein
VVFKNIYVKIFFKLKLIRFFNKGFVILRISKIFPNLDLIKLEMLKLIIFKSFFHCKILYLDNLLIHMVHLKIKNL